MNLFFKILFVILIAVPVYGADFFIDPTCGNPGNGSTAICDGTQPDNPLAAWPSVTPNNNYYQLVNTTYSCSTASTSACVDFNGDSNITIGAYYGDGNIGLGGNDRPIIENTLNPITNTVYTIMIRNNSDDIIVQDLQIMKGDTSLYIFNGSDRSIISNCDIGREAYEYGIVVVGCISSNVWDECDNGVLKNSRIDSDIAASGYTPADEGGSIQDGLFLACGADGWMIENNTFIDWPHAAISTKGIDNNDNPDSHTTSGNIIRYNYFGREDVLAYDFFRGIGGLGGLMLNNNHWYGNIVEGQTIRSQFGGDSNIFENNIWLNGTDAMNNNLAGGIHFMCSHTDGDKYIATNNIVRNNYVTGLANAAIAIGSNCYLVEDSGSHTGGTQAVLEDSGKSWTTNQWVGYGLNNISSASWCSITANTATTVTCIDWYDASGPVIGGWVNGNSYQIRELIPVQGNVVANNILENNANEGGASVTVSYYANILDNIVHNNIVHDDDNVNVFSFKGTSYTVAEFNALDGILGWSMKLNLTGPSLILPDYYLGAGSPGVDTGDNNYTPSIDYYGNQRPQGGGVDIGITEQPASLSRGALSAGAVSTVPGSQIMGIKGKLLIKD